MTEALTMIVGIIGFLAAIGVPLAWISHGMSDNPYDTSAKRLGNSLLAIALLCVLMLLALSGCAELRTLHHACRDGLCR